MQYAFICLIADKMRKSIIFAQKTMVISICNFEFRVIRLIQVSNTFALKCLLELHFVESRPDYCMLYVTVYGKQTGHGRRLSFSCRVYTTHFSVILYPVTG